VSPLLERNDGRAVAFRRVLHRAGPGRISAAGGAHRRPACLQRQARSRMPSRHATTRRANLRTNAWWSCSVVRVAVARSGSTRSATTNGLSVCTDGPAHALRRGPFCCTARLDRDAA